jgi:predicted AlkP superfamily phosphohydrolase/phosphomutase
MAREPQAPPLVLFALDAAEPGLMARWIDEGCMPTLGALRQRGGWGTTTGPEMIMEHGLWVSLLSGVSRAQHGYFAFRQLTPGTYDLRQVTPRMLDVEPFWASLRGRGHKVAIIDAPDSFPVAGLEGIQVSQWATHHNWDPNHPDLQPSAEPAGLMDEVRRVFGPQMTIIENNQATVDEMLAIYHRVLERVAKKGQLCRHLLARDRYDLIVVGLSETHPATHQFWRFRPGAPPVDGVAADHPLTTAMRDVYQAVDREVGLILEHLPPEANVVLVSSLGMDDYYPTTGLTEAFCRRLGYQATPAASTPTRDPLTMLRRIVPEPVRRALSRRLDRATRERLLAAQFRTGTDWGRTTAFAIPALFSGFIRVNLRGREPAGIVEPGAEYQRLLDRLVVDLEHLVDAETGRPAVKEVRRTTAIFGGDVAASLPDLFVEWQPGRFMTRVLHPRAELTQQRGDFFRASDHTRRGLVAVAGPSFPMRGDLGDVQVLDLAPTFLSLLGEPIPERMSGKVPRVMSHA